MGRRGACRCERSVTGNRCVRLREVMSLLRIIGRRQAAVIRTALLVGTAWIALAPQMAAAQTWTGNGGDSDWYNAANWDAGVLPESSMVEIRDSSSTISGGAATSGVIMIGTMGNTGALTITNGGALASQGTAVVAGSGGSNGSVIVDNAQWSNNGHVTIGLGTGTGTLSVLNGGTVSVSGTIGLAGESGGTGNATIAGTGSTLSAGIAASI